MIKNSDNYGTIDIKEYQKSTRKEVEHKLHNN